MTRPFQPEEIGRAAQVEETARAVHAAMEDAAITAKGDVHLSRSNARSLLRNGSRLHIARASTVTKGSYASMGYSRAASALGIALALEEIKAPIPDEAIAKDWSLYSSVASASAGIELLRSVVIVFGNSAAASSPYVMGHAVMRDAIDLKGVLEAFASTGIDPLAQSRGPMAP